MRLFISIDFNDLHDYFSHLQGQLDKELADINNASSYHLTLKFLGEVPEDKIKDIKEALKKIEFKPFSLTLGKIGAFPNENYIRVVWLGFKECKEIIELQKNVEDALKDFGFKKDHEFHPHITLGRVKYVKDKIKLKENLKSIKIGNKSIEAKDFKLMKSILTGKGAVYEELSIFKHK